MSLEIQQRERESVAILDLKGRITVGPEASHFRDTVSSLASADRKNVILNLGDVDYIDSTGLGALVICSTSLRKQGGNLKLVNLNKRNLELLVITKLATVFELFTDEQDAVNSFYPGREVKQFDILAFVEQLRLED